MLYYASVDDDRRRPHELQFVVNGRIIDAGAVKEFVEAGRRQIVEVRVRVGCCDDRHAEPAEVHVAFGTLHLVTPVYLLHSSRLHSAVLTQLRN